MKKIILFMLLAANLVAAPAYAATQTIKVDVNGMVCAFCAQGIEKKLRAMPQTKDVYVNLKRKIVAVELKEGQSVPLDTVKALVNDAGYDVTHIEAVGQTAQEIKAGIGKE
ncbi:MAG: cation transporter [Burkholderiaceae bacterium]|nr:cation transporter [Burkholderiaceae bacterium]